MTSAGTYYTLRCYFNDKPRFLGRNGRISVFTSERTLARYLADEHESDLSGFSTYEDIRTAATDGSLQIKVIDENVYVLSGLSDDIADGPDAVDRRPAGAGRRVAQGRQRIRRGQHRRGGAGRRSAARQVRRARADPRTRSASRPRPTPRPSSSGTSWRPSSNRGCARSDEFRGAALVYPRMTITDGLITRTLDVPGARLHYEVRGQGPLLFVVGSPMAAADFAPLAHALARSTTPSSPTTRAAWRAAPSTTPSQDVDTGPARRRRRRHHRRARRRVRRRLRVQRRCGHRPRARHPPSGPGAHPGRARATAAGAAYPTPSSTAPPPRRSSRRFTATGPARRGRPSWSTRATTWTTPRRVRRPDRDPTGRSSWPSNSPTRRGSSTTNYVDTTRYLPDVAALTASDDAGDRRSRR